jgi:single-stranded-DNA-specific exonuclease
MQIAERKFAPSTALTLIKGGIPPLLARVFAARGIRKAEDITGPLSDLHPYTELKGCVAMAELLADAILQDKRLLVLADYDADGATACSVAVRGLRAFGANVGFLIPKRLEHGYGLTPAIAKVAMAAEPKPDFIITVDNGIASHAGIQECNFQGVPVLVTDHHLPAADLPPPDARVIVNPNQVGCKFPSKAMAGCGVIWYVMWALQDAMAKRGILPIQDDYDVKSLLPIVAIGTVADVVALDRNNRILVNAGLTLIHKNYSFPGIDALAIAAKRNPRELTTGDIAFGVGPRINAAGRLQTMDAGVECLTTESVARAQALGKQLNELNIERQEIERKVVEQAADKLATELNVATCYSIVLHRQEWHEGVIGIAAGRIKERLWRPTFIMTSNHEGKLKGSGRSIPGFHLRDALDMVYKRNPNIFLGFGGHAMAAGVTLREGCFEEFQKDFEEVAHELLKPADLNQILETDGSLDIDEMSLDTVADLKLHPWGQAFPAPAFLDTFRVLEYRKLGENGDTLRMTLEKEGRKFVAVKFRQDPTEEIPPRIKAVFKLDANTFRNETSLQLLIDYFEPADSPV